jgi:phosphatidylglycerophosphate synthase
MDQIFDKWLKGPVKFLAKTFPNIHPNWYTAARLVLIIPIWITLQSEFFITAMNLILVAAFLDILDGPIARYKKMTSRTGAFMDPLADKLLFFPIIIKLKDCFPAVLFWAICSIEVILLIEHVYKFFYLKNEPTHIRKELQKSKLVGKVKFWAEMIGAGFAFFHKFLGAPTLYPAQIVMTIAVILAVTSLANHLKVYFPTND